MREIERASGKEREKEEESAKRERGGKEEGKIGDWLKGGSEAHENEEKVRGSRQFR